METASVDEKKLEELIDKAVRKYLSGWLHIDMEELRRSPAGIIIRLESRLDIVEKRLDGNTITRSELVQTIEDMKTLLDDLEATTGTRANFRKAIGQIKDRVGKLQAIIDEQTLL